jgi:aerobic-type carbon monoxide dehydrogenase small subunit (CoxS/CutS family)
MSGIHVDGTELAALPGATLSSVLVAAGQWILRRHELTGAPRGPFCGMGVCLECTVTVDGVVGVRACLTRARDGMTVSTGMPT